MGERPTTVAAQLAALIPKGRDYRHPFLTKDWRACIEDSDAPDVLFVVSPMTEHDPRDLAAAVQSVKRGAWLVECADTEDARAVLQDVGKLFKLYDDDRLFCASFDVEKDAVEWVSKAVWSTAFVNDLPDSAFLYVSPGGKKDDNGKTVPRSLRHFPVRGADGTVDLPHLRNALARIPQSNLPQSVKDAAAAAARRMLEETKKAHTPSGEHFHKLKLPDGSVVFTEADGAHAHAEYALEIKELEAAVAAVQSKALASVLRRDLPILKAAEERFVLGIVLEPNDGKRGAPLDPDAQQDVYSSTEVRTAAHQFMAEFRNIGLMHKEFINGQAVILESYVAPVDFALGSTKVRKGTWLLAIRVVDDTLWERIKTGELTGFSIGGSAVRRPASPA